MCDPHSPVENWRFLTDMSPQFVLTLKKRNFVFDFHLDTFVRSVAMPDKIVETLVWRGILDKNVIGSYHKVHYIEFACILSYRTRYAVMSYSVMLYCNRNTVLSYSVTFNIS